MEKAPLLVTTREPWFKATLLFSLKKSGMGYLGGEGFEGKEGGGGR